MKLKSVRLIGEQKFFSDRPMIALDPERDGVELSIMGDWIVVQSIKGATKGKIFLLHGSRTHHVEPAEDPRKK